MIDSIIVFNKGTKAKFLDITYTKSSLYCIFTDYKFEVKAKTMGRFLVNPICHSNCEVTLLIFCALFVFKRLITLQNRILTKFSF